MKIVDVWRGSLNRDSWVPEKTKLKFSYKRDQSVKEGETSENGEFLVDGNMKSWEKKRGNRA